jgi:flagellar hook protein FlgE
MAIDGNGFFIVQSGSAQKFTRDGSFGLNPNNQLVTNGGDFVQGFGVDASYNVVPGKLQNITIPLGAQTSAQQTSGVTMEGNLNANGVVATGATVLDSGEVTTLGGAVTPTTGTNLVNLAKSTSSTTPMFANGDVLTLQGTRAGRTITPPLTFTVTATSTVQQLQDFFGQGMQVDTTVTPPAPAPAPGVTFVAGATANSMKFTITGNTGTDNAISMVGALKNQSGVSPLGFTETAKASGESVHTSLLAYDSLGTAISVDVTAVLESSSTAGTTWRFFASSPSDTDAAVFTPGSPSAGALLGTGTLTFDNDGVLSGSTGTTLNIDRTATGARTPMPVTIDFNNMTSLTSSKSEMVMTQQDGSAIGTLNSFSIGTDGSITGSFSNGKTRTLGQVAVATFKNNQGLLDLGGNMYKTGPNSGVPIITSPLSLGAGSVKAGALELSNVDLSQEFINMIVSSTGFSAASRVITTSNQLIQELLNTSR